MEKLSFQHQDAAACRRDQDEAIIGVVASGNLEVLVERVLPDGDAGSRSRPPPTASARSGQAVVADFVERRSPGGLRISDQRRRRAPGHRVAAPRPGRPADGGGRA